MPRPAQRLAAGLDRHQNPERRPKRLSPTQIAEHIGKKSPDEELQRQIVDALAALCMAGAIHAAATNQSRSVATDASLPRSSDVKVIILCWRGSEMPRWITVTRMVRPRWRRVASAPRLIHAHASYAAI